MATTTRPPASRTIAISDQEEFEPMTQTSPKPTAPTMVSANPQALARGAVILVVLFAVGALILGNTGGSTNTIAASTDDSTQQQNDDNSSTPSGSTDTPATGGTTTVTTLPLRAPASIRILAANGTSTKGIGRRAQNVLANSGYNVLVAVDAKPTPTSAVYYTTGYEKEAIVVQTLFGFLPESVLPLPAAVPLKKPTDLMDASILVVVGTDGVAKIPA
jgi:hypothetical protein